MFILSIQGYSAFYHQSTVHGLNIHTIYCQCLPCKQFDVAPGMFIISKLSSFIVIHVVCKVNLRSNIALGDLTCPVYYNYYYCFVLQKVNQV